MSWIAQFQLGAAVALGLGATIEDIARRTISNWWPLLALLTGLFVHGSYEGWRGVATAFLGALAGSFVFMVFYVLGGMGGGDIKLMTGFGAIVGLPYLAVFAFWTAVIGGLIAAIAMIGSVLHKSSVRKCSIPYAPAITAGLWLTLASTYR